MKNDRKEIRKFSIFPQKNHRKAVRKFSIFHFPFSIFHFLRCLRLAVTSAVLAVAAVLPAPAAAQDHPSYGGAMPDTGGVDPRTDPRVLEVTRGLACNCGTCPHEPVNTCTCGTAARLRAEVAAFVSQGKVREQIVAAMVDRYTEAILPRPPFAGFNLLAYLGPFAAIAVAVFALQRSIVRWRDRATATAGSTPPPATAAAPDPYLEAVEAELARKGDA